MDSRENPTPTSAKPQLNIVNEADRIETLAHQRLDTSNTLLNYPTGDGLAAAKRLSDEWSSLEPDQRTAVANQLTNKYHNADLNTMPIPTIVTNLNGEMIGLQFDASFLDWHLGPSSIKLVATDGNLMEQRNPRFSSSKDPYLTEYAIVDAATKK